MPHCAVSTDPAGDRLARQARWHHDPASEPQRHLAVNRSSRAAPSTEAAARVHIRRAHSEDATAIDALEAHFTSDRIPPRSVRRFLRVPTAHSWVAERDGAVVGYLIWLSRANARRGRIYTIAVDPAARGLGLATRLLEAAEEQARCSGLAAMSLEVAVENGAARALYAKLGYAEIEPLPEYYEDGGDGLRLLKAL